MPTNNAWNSENPAQVFKGGTGRNTLTPYNLLAGNVITPVALIAPTATIGTPLISQGLAADPDYGIMVVPGGGTGTNTFTPYCVICGGTTTTSQLQNVAGTGNTTQLLTSNGPGALPTWKNAAGTAYSFLAGCANYDPLPLHTYVNFTNVYHNDGGVWDPVTNAYWAPVTGVYFFTFHGEFGVIPNPAATQIEMTCHWEATGISGYAETSSYYHTYFTTPGRYYLEMSSFILLPMGTPYYPRLAIISRTASSTLSVYGNDGAGNLCSWVTGCLLQ